MTPHDVSGKPLILESLGSCSYHVAMLTVWSLRPGRGGSRGKSSLPATPDCIWSGLLHARKHACAVLAVHIRATELDTCWHLPIRGLHNKRMPPSAPGPKGWCQGLRCDDVACTPRYSISAFDSVDVLALNLFTGLAVLLIFDGDPALT